MKLARLAVTVAVVAVAFTVCERVGLVPEPVLIGAAVLLALMVTAPVWRPVLGLLTGLLRLVLGLVTGVFGLLGACLRLVTGGSGTARKRSPEKRSAEKPDRPERRQAPVERAAQRGQQVGQNAAEMAESWRGVAENHEAKAAAEPEGFRRDEALKAARVAREREAAFRAEAAREDR